MKNILALTLITLVVMGCGQKPFPASRLSQPAGNFSFITPDGWFRYKLPGIDFLVISGPPDSGMQPNIFTEGIATSTNLSKTMSALINRYKTNYPSYAILNRDVFTTTSGMTGTKTVALRKTNEALQVSLFHYVIPNRKGSIQITCSCAKQVANRYEPLFDAAMKSICNLSN